MAEIYTCRMTKTITFDMKADSLQSAHDWCQTHDFKDVQEKSTLWNIEYHESVGQSEDDGYVAIDISSDSKDGWCLCDLCVKAIRSRGERIFTRPMEIEDCIDDEYEEDKVVCEWCEEEFPVSEMNICK